MKFGEMSFCYEAAKNLINSIRKETLHFVQTVRDIVSRLGVADVKAFGLTWEDCEGFLNQLGYTIRIEVGAR